MELGHIDESGLARYSSEVRGDSPEEREAFYKRVRDWTNRCGIILGEGAVSVFDNIGDGDFAKTYYLRAPIASGTCSPADSWFIQG